MYKSIEKLTNSKKKNIQIVGGEFNAELGPGYGVERVSVGPHTHSREENTRGDNTMYRKMTEKQATYRTPKGTEKTVGLHVGGQETYVLQQRRWSNRRDPHGKRSQKCCYGTICDYSNKKRTSHEKRTSPGRKFKQQSQDDEKRDPMKQSRSKSATPKSKEKSSMKPKMQSPHRSRE